MTGVKHAFTSGKADDADANLVNPSDWNDEHEPNLTTKGDLIVRGASVGLRLGVGSDGEALVAKASEAAGMHWEAVVLASLLTTRGDIIFRDASAPARLAKGTSGYVLKQGANDPAWAICPTKDLVTTAGDLLYATAADVLARLAIGTKTQLLAVNAGATALEYVQPGISILGRDLTQDDNANNSGLYGHRTVTVPANALGTTGGIRLTAAGDYLNDSSISRDIQVWVKFGGESILVTPELTFPDDSDRRKWRLVVEIINSAADAQKASAQFNVSAAITPTLAVSAPGSTSMAHGPGLAAYTVDTTAEITVGLESQHSAAHASLSFRQEMVLVELLPAA